ncbi:modification methylase [Candidatus Saccharibacteria bacterium]|nr:modification methylase [Candidatus Saccharibacteria bacterium]
MATTSLRTAKTVRNDEHYTQLSDVENEIRRYKSQLAGKVVFCNCDDPFESNFFKYFAMNFNQLELKKLIVTCYDPSPIADTQISLFGDDVTVQQKGMKKSTRRAYKIELDHITDMDGNGSVNITDVEEMLKAEKQILQKGGKSDILSYLNGDGDFRSDECVELLKRSDVVITNPPFSLFREYIAQLFEYDKKFVIIAPDTALHYKEVFKLIMENQVWLGYGRAKQFMQPDGTMKKFGNIGWLTNLDTTKRHEVLTLYKKYTPEEYPTYDNLDAIDVKKTAEIPYDYDGYMGVPDTFLDKFNPEQFELIGIPFGNLGKEIGVTKNYRGRTDVSITKDGKTKCPYSRIIIKRKALNNDN